MLRTSEDWIEEYQKKKALWFHDGNPLRPHALLASGKHSNGFFNSRLVITDEQLLREAANDLIFLYIQLAEDIENIDRVVGPQSGATKLSEFISDEVYELRGRNCRFASPAKREGLYEKEMFFDGASETVFPGENVLLCEDVLTTGGSVELASDTVVKKGGILLPFVVVLVNRSDQKRVNNKKIICLINRHMPIWQSEACPLCKDGSEAIYPKDEANWARLNATY